MSKAQSSKTPRVEIARRGKEIVLSVYDGISEHRVFATAAGVAYYMLLAIFPAIAAIVSLYGLFSNPDAIANHLHNLSGVLPAGALSILKQQLTRLAAGGLFAALTWIGASYLFSWYTASFGSYNKTYGSLAAVIIFMTWLWISVVVVLVGAEIDAALAVQNAPGERVQPHERASDPKV